MQIDDAEWILTRLRDYEWVAREDAVEAHRIACEALEKQIPKKPKPVKRNNRTAYECPTCGSTQVFFGGCANCLQKLDWSDQ